MKELRGCICNTFFLFNRISVVNLKELIGTSEIPPIIRIVNAIISEAIRYGASDIHIEPKAKATVVRYRIDGMLQSKMKIPPVNARLCMARTPPASSPGYRLKLSKWI